MTPSGEIIRNAASWPLNFCLLFPARIGRLVGTLTTWEAATGDAVRGMWLLRLLVDLFDLLGMPELFEFWLRLLTSTRAMTDDEWEAAVEVLGPNALRYNEVRVARGGLLRVIFRLNKGRAFAAWHTVNLPTHKASDIPLLVHELIHVCQYEIAGSIYIVQGLLAQRRLGRAAYDYGGISGLIADRAGGKMFRHYNREQQGQIAQDYSAALRSGGNIVPYEPFINDLREGAL